VEVSALSIAEFSSNREHIAGIANAKARLLRETDGEIQRAVNNGVGNVTRAAGHPANLPLFCPAYFYQVPIHQEDGW